MKILPILGPPRFQFWSDFLARQQKSPVARVINCSGPDSNQIVNRNALVTWGRHFKKYTNDYQLVGSALDQIVKRDSMVRGVPKNEIQVDRLIRANKTQK